MLILPALGKLRQENHEIKASLGHRARCCLEKKKKKVRAAATKRFGPGQLAIQSDSLPGYSQEAWVSVPDLDQTVLWDG